MFCFLKKTAQKALCVFESLCFFSIERERERELGERLIKENERERQRFFFNY